MLTLEEIEDAINVAEDSVSTEERKKERRISQGCMQRVLSSLDHDGTGRISYSDFIAAAIANRNFMRESLLKEAFALFDRNGSRTINRDELKELLTADIGGENLRVKDLVSIDDEVERVFADCDTNHDGSIDFEEFKAML